MTAVVTTATLAAERQLPLQFLLELGIADLACGLAGPMGGVVIPYWDMDGDRELFRRERDNPRRNARFWQPAGIPLRPYGLWRLDRAARAGFLVLVEGESDCWALWHHNVPALGLPGSGTAGCLDAEHVSDVERIYIVREPGASGTQFVGGVRGRLERLGWKGEAFEVRCPDGTKDPCELHQRELERFGLVWDGLMRAARRLDGETASSPPAGKPGGESKPVPKPIFVCLSDVVREPVRWLMRPWIPEGHLTILDGDPGLGKSTITLDLAARISRGWTMPPGDGVPDLVGPGGVLLLSAEDSLKHTIGPRLDAAGANSSRVFSLGGVQVGDEEVDPILPWALTLIGEMVAREKVRLIIVDPLMAFLGTEYDAHKDQDIRRCLRPLSQLAEKLGVAMLLLRHLNKLNGGAALYRGGGSIGILGAARAAHVVGRDPEKPERHVMAGNKVNLGPLPTSLAYRIVEAGISTRIQWEGETKLGKDDILWHATAQGPHRPRGRPDDPFQKALQTLASAITTAEPVPVSEIRRGAEKAGISWETILRAKRELGLKSLKVGAAWFWFWPAKEGSQNSLGVENSDHLPSEDDVQQDDEDSPDDPDPDIQTPFD